MKTKAPIIVKGKVVVQRPELANKKSHKPTASEADCGCGGDMKKQSGGAIDTSTIAKASIAGSAASMISNKKAKQAASKAASAADTLASNNVRKGLKATIASTEPKQRGLLYKCGGGMKKSKGGASALHTTPKKQAGGPFLPVPGANKASSYATPIRPMASYAIPRAVAPVTSNIPGIVPNKTPILQRSATALPAMTSEERAYMAGVLKKRQEDRAKLESSRQTGR